MKDYETFYQEHEMHNTTQTRYNTQKWDTRMKNMYCEHQTIKTNKTHITNSTKIYPNHIRTSFFFSKTQQKHKIQEIKGLKHEILWENKKTHTLFLKIGEEMMKKMEV